MFTGLVESVGTIEAIVPMSAGLELTVRCDYSDLVEGESISVNGACLTVRTCERGLFTVAAVATTLERTAIGHWKAGRRVNLERAARVGDRLGGHLVLGHVDCVATVVELERRVDALLLDIPLRDDVWELMAPLGSVTVDGVSLTVNALPSRGTVQISLIPFTLERTTLGMLAPGDRVHVEGDMIGKHVRRLSEAWRSEP